MVFLNGCVSTQKLTMVKDAVKVTEEKATDKNKEIKSELGNPVYSYNLAEITKKDLYRLKNEITFPNPYINTWTGLGYDTDTKIRMPTDSTLNGSQYINDEKKSETWVHYSDVGSQQYTFGCYFVIDSGRLTRMSYGVTGKDNFIYNFESPASVQKEIKDIDKVDIFSYELLYTGIQNNSIVLTYREYAKNRITSAFTQNYFYNLGEIKDNVIKYKDITIKILEYNNQFIRYMIL